MASFSPSRARDCNCGTVTLFAAFWALMGRDSWSRRPGGRRGEFCPRRARLAILCTAARPGGGLASAGRWRGAAKALLRPVEEFAPAAHRVQALDEEVQVLRDLHEVQALAVHDEERAVGVVVEVARVRLGEPAQVRLLDAALGRVAALLH